MNDYVEYRIDLTPMPGEDATDLLAAMLGEVGFESFVPDENGLTAYAPVKLFDADAARAAIADFPFDTEMEISYKVIEGQDWNSEWEKNYFQPIVVGDRCVVHSSFHTDVPQAKYDIVIDPKMAFGTGHHATTSLMLDRLLDMELDGLGVIDMGTGTGILAILAAMRGAHPVTGIEIDPFAQVNAVENVALNGHPEIEMIAGDATALAHVAAADVFLANINRNVILADIKEYVSRLKQGGVMFLSGFYTQDVPMVQQAAEDCGLAADGFTSRDNWACLKLLKL